MSAAQQEAIAGGGLPPISQERLVERLRRAVDAIPMGLSRLDAKLRVEWCQLADRCDALLTDAPERRSASWWTDALTVTQRLDEIERLLPDGWGVA